MYRLWPAVHSSKITPHEMKDEELFFWDQVSVWHDSQCWCKNVSLLIFRQIYREVLHPLHHEEAESSSEAQDDHQQELPHQQDVSAVEERHCCKNRLTEDRRFYFVVWRIKLLPQNLTFLDHRTWDHVLNPICKTKEFQWHTVMWKTPRAIFRNREF